MDEQIRSVLRGLRATVLENRAIKKILLGSQAISKTITWMFGSIPAYFLMMAICVMAGMVNFYIAVDADPAGLRGGIQLVAGDSVDAQMTFSILLVMYGAFVGYIKRMEWLAIGAIMWIWYAFLVAGSTLAGNTIPQGWLATIYIIGFVGGVCIAVVSQAKVEKAEAQLRETSASVKALREANAQLRTKGP